MGVEKIKLEDNGILTFDLYNNEMECQTPNTTHIINVYKGGTITSKCIKETEVKQLEKAQEFNETVRTVNDYIGTAGCILSVVFLYIIIKSALKED